MVSFKQKIQILLIVIFSVYSSFVYAQSPGGVSTNLKLWLKADSGVTPATQDAAVTNWNDQSGGSNNAQYTTPIFAQTVVNPTYQLNSLNFNSTLRFAGTGNANFSTIGGSLSPAITSNNISSYIVFLMNSSSSTSARAMMISQNSDTSDWLGQANAGLVIRTGNNITTYRNGVQGPTAGPVLGATVISSTHFTTDNQWRIDSNGNPLITTTFNATAFNSGYYRLGTSTYSANDWFNGDIAEVILYDADQSSLTSHNQIESYLALKYGIHKTGNYVNTSNTNIWDATANSSYHNDVFGIGQDDDTALLQTQSNSTNTGSGDGTGQSGKGNIVISNPSDLANNEFLMIGHDTSSLNELNVVVGGNTVKRVERTWKVQTTGNPGTISLSYDITGLTSSGSISSDYLLLVDPTGAGDFSSGSIVQYPAASFSGNKLSFNTVDLPTGSVFTFQTLAAPTIQATNVSFTNTTTTSTTASWTNGNGSSRAVFMFAGASGSPLPVDDTTYTANTTFGIGTQIGTTGWYCVYNGTGTTVDITGLNPATTYQVMAVEYNGATGNELYLSTTSTGNPADVTTLSNIATLSNLSISEGTLDPVFASGTTSYTATVPNVITSLTVTPTTTSANATVTVNGTAVTSGSPSGAISLNVGPNVITTIVTAQDGTTIETYTITVTRTEPTIVASGTLSAFTAIYGAPSVSQTFTVSGTDMAQGILVTPPTGFEVSADNSTFTNTVMIGAAGVIASTPVYVRLKGTVVAGSYSGNIVLTSSNAANVNVSTVASTVNPAPLTITADNKTKLYGEVIPTLTITYSGFVNGDTEGSLTLAPIIGTAAVDKSDVGVYTITVNGAANPNYTISHVDGVLTITEAALTITADNQTKTYGSVNPTLTVTYSGFVFPDTAASLTTQPTITTTATDGSPVGSYPITASGAVSSNYAISYVDGSLTVTQATLTITADNQSKTYGSANPTLTASYSGFVNGDTEASLTTAPTISTTADTASDVGSYPITASGAVSSNYTISYVDGSLTVTTALLVITANNQTKTYGSVNPTLTASYSGFVNGDTQASLTTLPTISTTADTASAVGSYPITASGAVSSNYTIGYVNGSLTVTQATLTITADDKTKTYGSANPTLTASYSGFVNGDTAANLTIPPTISTTADATSTVGIYPITASGAVSSNYTISYVDGRLTVTQATLTITADNKTKTYGSANPTLTASYSGFVNGDTAASLTTPPTISTTAIDGSSVGSYPITASGAISSNYAISYVDGTLTVTQATLTITADNQTKTYGEANPTLTASYSGFVNGDTQASLTTLPTITTTADTASAVGSYPITASGAVSSNYTISYVDGSLTITTAALVITADDKTKTYGSANPTLTASYSGFVNGDTETSLTTPPTISTTADAASAVGSYPIIASGASSSNYTISYVDGSLTVTQAILTITADNQTKTYGEANPTLTASYSGFVNGDTAASLTMPPTITTTADVTSAVGSYPITASGAVSSNYTITYVDGSLTVTTASLVITADNQTKTYGSANPTLTASYTGFVNGDTEASLTTPPTISTTADTASGVGSYPITASGAVSSNYTISYVDGSLTVTQATLTITADNQTKTYGSANPTLTASYSGFVNGDTEASLTTPPTISTTADLASDVGSYPITASGAVSSNYAISHVDGTLTITTASLVITADNQTKTYGSANPTLTASYSGFVNGDTAASLTTPPTISTTAIDGSPVGSYPITASGAVSSNYTISYVDGSLTVTPATLTITADNQTKTYGSANPTLTASYSGFVNGDTEASLTTPPTISTTADVASTVGNYPITASVAISSNYTISYVDGSLTVTQAILIITADDKTKTYGSANPALTTSYSGFVNGDTALSLTTPPTITTTAVDGSPVGSYPITASGASSSNYTISYVDGSLTVTTATLTITADNQSKIYGSSNPTLTASYSGFVNGDTAASLTTPPTISTTADATSTVGIYPITASGAVSSNYTISYVDGSLTVTPATLTITADNQTKTYGSANPTLTASYSGFVNGDTETSLTTPPTITTTAINESPVGSYPITASGAVSPNYTISYVDGSLTVTTVALVITADNQTKTYGSANPTLTASYFGFVNGDTAASLTTPPTITTTADITSAVGSYPITASGAASSNYTISYVDGSLTVTQATLTITADNQTKTYGSANPTLTASYSGFVNGDTEASLTTPPIISTTADVASAVGSYPIIASGAVSSNYTISYVDGSLTVTQATLTITADNKTKTYGSANPTLTASYSGFVNGDTETSLTTPPTISTTADAASAVGSYPITASGAISPNYTISYVDGSLTVTQATLTITADNQTKTYGSANPTLTASYSGFVNGDTAASLTTPPTITTTAVDGSPVGSYPITASGASSSNYAISYVEGTLTVTTAGLVITADNQTKTYGSANPALTTSYSGFVNGDTAASLTTPPTISTTADATSTVGIYPITASGAVSSNYTISYVDGSLTVTPATLTITADDKTKTYGSANPTLTASYSGFVNGDTEASLTTAPTITTTAIDGSPVGSYPIIASGAVSSNYTISYVDGSLTVTQATLTITADNQSKTYGSANPTLTASYSGFINGDTETSLTTPPTITTTADVTSTVGSYPITASGAVSSNYTISYVDGSLTVTTASLVITADNQTKTYGSANPRLTASYSGFVNGDTEASLITPPTISTTADVTSTVGSYPITASGAVSSNYTISYVAGSLTVTQATLTITADNQTKTYGSANPTLTASYSGFVNGDTEASLTTPPTISTTADTASAVGSYPITASGAVGSNYTISYVDGSLTVTPATLTITADNQTKTYGSVNPTLTASYSGFVNGDTEASLTIPPTISTTAIDGSPVGSYPITASGAVSSNYTISYVDGSLTVTQATLTITADNQAKTYGSANPTLTASYSGFVNGDTAASLNTPSTISTTADATSAVGLYPITASGASSSNYTISYVDGSLTVTTASLVITADNQTKTYGSANPTLTASYSGFVNGDTEASLTTPPTISTTAIDGSPVGSYPITASGAIGTNYTISYIPGILTITPSSSVDVDLTSLSVSNGVLNPAFSPNIVSYSVTVANNIDTETITVTSDDPLASITVNGTVVLNGSSTEVPLVVGNNPIVVIVTSQDGSVTKNYTVNVTRESSNNATLTNLAISEGTLKPSFESNITNYSTTVKYDINSITVTPTVTDPTATITVNELAVANNTASAPIILKPGENSIETVVTAQDGITKQTYTILVYKGVSPESLVINNIISPNGDGKNDFWEIQDIQLFPNNKVTVFDRAGRIVYSKNGYGNEWDGSYEGSPLNYDTYYYLIDLGDDIPKIKGFITMLKN